MKWVTAADIILFILKSPDMCSLDIYTPMTGRQPDDHIQCNPKADITTVVVGLVRFVTAPYNNVRMGHAFQKSKC